MSDCALLPAPYGYQHGTHISLQGADSEPLGMVLLSYSCWPPAIPKIKSCLASSGRYDCVVQNSWFRNQAAGVLRDLQHIGVKLVLL